jgi:hypothetical protein
MLTIAKACEELSVFSVGSVEETICFQQKNVDIIN